MVWKIFNWKIIWINRENFWLKNFFYFLRNKIEKNILEKGRYLILFFNK